MSKKMVKAMTLRLPAEQAEELGRVAEIDGVTVADEVRQAIAAHLATRRQDAEFQERLRRLLERNQEILARLAER